MQEERPHPIMTFFAWLLFVHAVLIVLIGNAVIFMNLVAWVTARF